MFITSKNKYLSNDMNMFGTCSIPLNKREPEHPFSKVKKPYPSSHFTNRLPPLPPTPVNNCFIILTCKNVFCTCSYLETYI